MDNLRDPQFLVTIAILLSSAIGNYFAITTKFEFQINNLKEISIKHVEKEPYEIRMSYHENELSQHEQHIHDLDNYLISKYPDWAEYRRQRNAKNK